MVISWSVTLGIISYTIYGLVLGQLRTKPAQTAFKSHFYGAFV
jgi:hypothetical protein